MQVTKEIEMVKERKNEKIAKETEELEMKKRAEPENESKYKECLKRMRSTCQ